MSPNAIAGSETRQLAGRAYSHLVICYTCPRVGLPDLPKMSDTYLRVALIAALIVCSATFTAAEMGLVAVGRLKLRKLAADGSGRADSALRLLDNPTLVFSTVLITITTANFVAESLAANLFHDAFGEHGYLLSFITMTVVVLVFAELTPVLYAVSHPSRVALGASGLVRGTTWLLYPLSWTLTGLARVVLWLMGIRDFTGFPAGVSRGALEASVESGAIREEEKELLSNVFEFKDTLAREIMRPRVDIIALPAYELVVDALEKVLKSGHSRLPVYEGDIDNIVGILFGKDLIPYTRTHEEELGRKQITELMRPAFFVPETEHIGQLLRDMRTRRQLLAIVVDEFGGTAGVVTIEDVLEEIVGDIQDEFDEQEVAQLKEIAPGVWTADGLLPLHELRRQTDITLPETSVETVGGFVADQLQRVPEQGDVVEYRSYRFEVLLMDGRRVARVQLVLLPEEDDKTGPESDDLDELGFD